MSLGDPHQISGEFAEPHESTQSIRMSPRRENNCCGPFFFGIANGTVNIRHHASASIKGSAPVQQKVEKIRLE
jgi:hypothetical protein